MHVKSSWKENKGASFFLYCPDIGKLYGKNMYNNLPLDSLFPKSQLYRDASVYIFNVTENGELLYINAVPKHCVGKCSEYVRNAIKKF